MRFSFPRTADLSEAKAFLTRALSGNRFPHALLLHGPEGAGQNALLLDLADILACESDREKPCGTCPPCRAGKSGNREQVLFMPPLETATKSDDGPPRELQPAQMDELIRKWEEFRENPYACGLSEKDRIRIVQARDLQGRIGYARSNGKAQIVIIPWAERMEDAAPNAMLKTLEEPPPDTYFLLSSSDKAGILPTILSRCTLVMTPPMDSAELRAAMEEKKEWWDGPPPHRLAPFAEGSLGALLVLHRQGGEVLLEEAGRFLSAALGEDWQSFASYLEGSETCQDAASAARLLDLVLRMIRRFHGLAALDPAARNGAQGIAAGLVREGWDAAAAPMLAPLSACREIPALAAFVEASLSAIQGYAKPDNTLLGNYLEFESRGAGGKSRA